MLRNYATIALRRMWRERAYTSINIIGLAVGVASCLLILLFVRDERSYDRFHEKADRIYRVVNGNGVATSAAMAPALISDIPEVENAVRLSRRWAEVLVRYQEERFYENEFFFTDPAFFDIFSFPLIAGDPKTALVRPFTIVITQETAEKYFGHPEPLGQTLSVEGGWGAYDFEVTGVIANPPHNSHFQFDLLGSFATRYETEPRPENIDSWAHVGDLTYLVLEEGATPEQVMDAIPVLSKAHNPYYRPEHAAIFSLQAMTDIHLYSNLRGELAPNSDPRYLYIFSVIALFILGLACVNYINLATARSSRRGREVGVRKAVGANRAMLARQFMLESVLISFVAVALGIAVLELALPAFNTLTEKALIVPYGADPVFWLSALGILLLVGGIAGSYPAFVLSGFHPVGVLKGIVLQRPKQRYVRNGLVVLQFAVSVVLIIGTIVVQKQLDYMQDRRLGIAEDYVVVLDTRRAIDRNNSAVLREALFKHSRVLDVTTTSSLLPSREGTDRGLLVEGFERGKAPSLYSLRVDTSFFSFMDIAIVKGEKPRTYRKEDQIDVWVNEAFVKAHGWEEPLGKTFTCCFRPTPKVVGVVSDFHYRSVKERIEPAVFMASSWVNHVYVRIQGEDIAGTLEAIEAIWAEVIPDYPMDYSFLDEEFDQLYQAEDRLARIFGLFASLAIVIACLGLFGLAAFTAEQRTKEIGIRKVLGATVSHIVVLLSNQFVRLVVLSFVFAFPLAYFATTIWLQDFAYPIPIQASLFIWAGVVALAIAVGTVMFQAVQAAVANPIDSLRHD